MEKQREEFEIIKIYLYDRENKSDNVNSTQRQVAWHLTPSSSSNELGDRSYNLSSVLVHFADQIMSVINIFLFFF